MWVTLNDRNEDTTIPVKLFPREHNFRFPLLPPHPPPKQINLKFCSHRHIFKESVAILLRALFTDLISTLICSQISSTNQSPCKFVMIIKAIYIRIWQIWFLCQLFCIIFTITVSCGYNTG